ncbi:MAG: branched-chain amino acid ABC transporter permease [Desulfatiglans sp.]|jgi:branched-chain amino acid transport system permease protein|nr:branched-chain amino acid ABC transporter permease [Thermodesulfobacteriota bacterium]MEE4354155.1 branched-chain amino acid ABC transporter permease [Desulfatiglans sp.]
MFFDILINGMVAGGMYALLAVGFALIFGVAKIFNMAHTGFYMITSFFMLIGSTVLKWPLAVTILPALVATVLLGLVCFKLFFDRIKEHETAVMIISVALAMLFQELLLLSFGGHYRGVSPLMRGFAHVMGIRVSYQHLIAVGSTMVILAMLWYLLAKTKTGKAIRTVAEDKEVANLVGINVSRVYMTVMAISVAIAGLAGVVVAPIYMVSPLMWVQPLTIVLAAVVLGGLGSIGGCVLGAFILGYTETVVTFLVPGGAFLRGAVSLTIMICVLLIRPEGLFGVVFEEERL